jgi:hypothetical protein
MPCLLAKDGDLHTARMSRMRYQWMVVDPVYRLRAAPPCAIRYVISEGCDSAWQGTRTLRFTDLAAGKNLPKLGQWLSLGGSRSSMGSP